MKKSTLAIFCFLASTAFSTAHALGPQMIQKEFKCGDGRDYAVYIVQTSGITLSYSLKAFCSVEAGKSLASCTEEDTPESRNCFAQFNQLNKLRAGDGGLKIVHGR